MGMKLETNKWGMMILRGLDFGAGPMIFLWSGLEKIWVLNNLLSFMSESFYWKSPCSGMEHCPVEEGFYFEYLFDKWIFGVEFKSNQKFQNSHLRQKWLKCLKCFEEYLKFLEFQMHFQKWLQKNFNFKGFDQTLRGFKNFSKQKEMYSCCQYILLMTSVVRTKEGWHRARWCWGFSYPTLKHM